MNLRAAWMRLLIAGGWMSPCCLSTVCADADLRRRCNQCGKAVR